MENKGYDKLEASLPLVFLSVFETITCLVMVPIGHKFKGNLIYVSIFSCLATSMLFFVWPSIDPSFVDIMILSSGLYRIFREILQELFIYCATIYFKNN